METSGLNSDGYRGSLASTSTSDHHYHHSRRNNGNNHFSASNFFRSPVSTFLEYMGILQTQGNTSHSDSLINDGHTRNESPGSGDEEVSIRIIGNGEQGQYRDGGGASSSTVGQMREGTATQNESLVQSISRTVSAATIDTQGDSRSDGVSASIRSATDSVSGNVDAEAAQGVGVNNSRDSPYQRYDIQQAARWAEQVLPFTLLLLVVFIRRHLEVIPGMEGSLDIVASARGLPQMVIESINKCDVDIRRELFSSILLAGGTTSMQQLKERLEKDLLEVLFKV